MIDDEPILPLEQRLRQFDPELYLKLHPDMASVGMNALEHLVRHPLREGRAWPSSPC